MRLTAEQLRAWLDRGLTPRPANYVDAAAYEASWWPARKTWRDWFDADGEYLGERSARTGDDPVPARGTPGGGR